MIPKYSHGLVQVQFNTRPADLVLTFQGQARRLCAVLDLPSQPALTI